MPFLLVPVEVNWIKSDFFQGSDISLDNTGFSQDHHWLVLLVQDPSIHSAYPQSMGVLWQSIRSDSRDVWPESRAKEKRGGGREEVKLTKLCCPHKL